MMINGKWLFNATISITSNIDGEHKLDLTSNGKNYKAISVSSFIGYFSYTNYNAQGEPISDMAYDPDTETWENEAYRTVDFGDTEQEVTELFYTWLVANATQIIEPIEPKKKEITKLIINGEEYPIGSELLFVNMEYTMSYDEIILNWSGSVVEPPYFMNMALPVKIPHGATRSITFKKSGGFSFYLTQWDSNGVMLSDDYYEMRDYGGEITVNIHEKALTILMRCDK